MAPHHFEADSMQADFAEVGTADFSEICLLVSVAGEARAGSQGSACHKEAQNSQEDQ